MVDEVVEPPDLLDRALSVATRLASFEPAAYALTKRELHRPAVEAITAGAATDVEVRALWESSEGQARIAAQVEAIASRHA